MEPRNASVLELIAGVRASPVASQTRELSWLAQRGAEAVPALIDALRYEGDTPAAARYAEALLRIGAPDALPALDVLERFARTVQTVDGRFWSCMALAHLGRPDAVVALMDAPLPLAREAAHALVGDSPRSLPWIEQALCDPRPAVSDAMTFGLSMASSSHTRSFEPALLASVVATATRGRHMALRRHAVDWLGSRTARSSAARGRTAVAALVGCLADAESEVRLHAAVALECLGPRHARTARAALAAMAEHDPVGIVRNVARHALVSLDEPAV